MKDGNFYISICQSENGRENSNQLKIAKLAKYLTKNESQGKTNWF